MLLEVRVQPKAKRNCVELVGSALRVRVTAAPEGGKANDAVIGILAKRLGVARRAVTIVRGHRARAKIVQVEGLTESEVFARLSLK